MQQCSRFDSTVQRCGGGEGLPRGRPPTPGRQPRHGSTSAPAAHHRSSTDDCNTEHAAKRYRTVPINKHPTQHLGRRGQLQAHDRARQQLAEGHQLQPPLAAKQGQAQLRARTGQNCHNHGLQSVQPHRAPARRARDTEEGQAAPQSWVPTWSCILQKTEMVGARTLHLGYTTAHTTQITAGTIR